jgi:hypothetical protein
MLIFSDKDKKRREAQGFLTKIINNQSSALRALQDGPRGDRRCNASLPAYIVPMRGSQPDVMAAVATVTKELSVSGVSVVLCEPLVTADVLIGVHFDGTAYFFRARVCHQDPMGAGMWQTGFEISELVPNGEYDVLRALKF